MVVYHLTAANVFEQCRQDTTNYKKIVLMLSGNGCQPCQNIMPRVTQLSTQYPDILFLKALSHEVPELFGGHGIPMFKLFKSGKLWYHFTGADNGKLTEAVKKLSQL